MPKSLFFSPAADFDQPRELLESCHERVLRMTNLLDRLRVHLAEQGADADARSAAGQILRYFDIAAPQHHEDEARHVFPRLRERGAAELAAALEAEHRAMNDCWSRVRLHLNRVVDGGLPDAAEIEGDWPEFMRLNRKHVASEELQAYPAAFEGVPEADLRSIGDEMARRRGLR